MELSQPVRGILDKFTDVLGNLEISESDASRLFLGKSQTTVVKMSDTQLLQLVICHQFDYINELRSALEEAVNRLAKQPNREARRHGGR
jgi:hypothetical protein